MPDAINKKVRDGGDGEKVVVYGILAMIFIAVALLSAFLVPRSSGGIGRCNGILLSQGRYSCLFSLALSSENASVCSHITEASQDPCYSQVAIETLQPETCTDASNYNYTVNCVETIANKTDSYAACKYLKGNYSGDCVEGLALKLDNPEACTSISDSLQSALCSSGIYIALARSEENSSYCGLVYNTTNQTLVAQMLLLAGEKGSSNSTFGLLALSPVLEIESHSYPYGSRDLCYLSVASSGGSNSSCLDISNSSLRSTCLSFSYKASGAANSSAGAAAINSSVCAAYGGSELASCDALISISQAVSGRNASFCAQIPNTSYEYQCYISLARTYNDTSYCGYIPNATTNEACLADIYYNFT
jgi:hypothetical protein